jgi:ATP-dependent Lhr-like helicase
LYATNKWSLLQSIACWTLYKEGYIEPPVISDKPFDILLHQALSIVKSTAGIAHSELVRQLKINFAFSNINEDEIKEILDHLLQIDFLEKIQQELIIGVEGEYVVNSREFYTVFETPEDFKVIHQGKTIGSIPYSAQLLEHENIFLAARIWKITYVDEKAKKIEVAVANDGKKPNFPGSGIVIHPRIRHQMLEILYSNVEYDFLDQLAADAIKELRREFSTFKLQNLGTDRPLMVGEIFLEFYSFTGTRINRAIGFLLTKAGIKNIIDEHCSLIDIEAKQEDFHATLLKIAAGEINFDLEDSIILKSSKWSVYLPDKYQNHLLQNSYFDFEGAHHFLKNLKVIINT